MTEQIERPQPLWRTALYSVGFGLAYGSVWSFPFAFESFKVFALTLIPFAAFFLVLGVVSHFVALTLPVLLAGSLAGGIVGGVVWWVLLPWSVESIVQAVCAGSVGGLIWMFVEGHFFLR